MFKWQSNRKSLRTIFVKLPGLHAQRGGVSPSLVLVYGFAAIIIIGSAFLLLPAATQTGRSASPVDALFTATSAVCVTGLVVVDTGTYWSHFGQGVLLLLFQIGGLGFTALATMFLLALGRRIGLRERLLIQQTMGVERLGGLVTIMRRLVAFTFIVEGAGILILFLRLSATNPPLSALWSATFHAVSAFNNCGMDIFGNFKSLIDFQTDPTILLTTAALIIIGGLGYIVVQDVLSVRSFHKLSTDSKVVLVTTFWLLVLGTAFILLAEFGNPSTIGILSFPGKLLVSFFQAVTPRTAGFSAVDIGKMSGLSLFLTMFLMFVGGASASTAGGIKVNTFGLLVSTAWCSVQGKEHPGAFGREFTEQNIYRALVLVMLYLAFVALAVIALSLTENFGFVNILFESFSAMGTVGLSTGITPGLSTVGRLILVFVMFAGRLGPLTLALTIAQRQRPAEFRYPEDIVRIG